MRVDDSTLVGAIRFFTKGLFRFPTPGGDRRLGNIRLTGTMLLPLFPRTLEMLSLHPSSSSFRRLVSEYFAPWFSFSTYLPVQPLPICSLSSKAQLAIACPSASCRSSTNKGWLGSVAPPYLSSIQEAYQSASRTNSEVWVVPGNCSRTLAGTFRECETVTCTMLTYHRPVTLWPTDCARDMRISSMPKFPPTVTETTGLASCNRAHSVKCPNNRRGSRKHGLIL